MRHKNVNMCAIGALARFNYTEEMNGLDFADDRAWFDINLLTDPNGKNPNISVKDQNYTNAVKKVCKALHIHSDHAIHIGRCVGAVTADMSELQNEVTKLLGNGFH